VEEKQNREWQQERGKMDKGVTFGLALNDGVIFGSTDCYVVAKVSDKGDLKISEHKLSRPPAILSMLLNIPFVAGVVLLVRNGICPPTNRIEGIPKMPNYFTFAVLIDHLVSMLIGYAFAYLIYTEPSYSFLYGIVIVFPKFISSVLAMLLIASKSGSAGYHGAEHKVYNAYLKGKDITLDNVILQSKLSVHCSSNEFVTASVLSVFMFAILYSYFCSFWIAVILVIPVAVSCSFEYTRICKLISSLIPSLGYVFNAFGIISQYYTVQEPSNNQCAVAIKAFEALIEFKEKQKQ
jgi:uncharacterized protein YqhQ